MSDKNWVKKRGQTCDKTHLSASQGLCNHPERKCVFCVTALKENKCPVNEGQFCRKAEKAKRYKFWDTVLLPICITILLGAMLCCYVVGYNIGKDQGKSDGLAQGIADGIQQGIQQENARAVFAGNYTMDSIVCTKYDLCIEMWINKQNGEYAFVYSDK